MRTLQEVRYWAAQAQPVFICGLERSGTSMLQVSLSRHPSLFPVRDVYETFMFLKPRAALETLPPQMTLAYLQGEENARGFRALCDELRAGGSELSEADIIRSFFFFCAQRVYPGRRPLEKTPAHVRKLNAMLQIFPKARVIVCTREPVSIIASYRKRLAAEKALGRPWSEWSWLDRTAEQLVAHFEAVTEQIEIARGRWPRQVFMAPYDWIVADAPQALRELCDFAGLAFVPEVLSPAEVSGRKVDELLSRPITNRPSDDEHYVSADEADHIRRLTAALMPLWQSPGVALPTP
jgi:hypothetical protein